MFESIDDLYRWVMEFKRIPNDVADSNTANEILMDSLTQTISYLIFMDEMGEIPNKKIIYDVQKVADEYNLKVPNEDYTEGIELYKTIYNETDDGQQQ